MTDDKGTLRGRVVHALTDPLREDLLRLFSAGPHSSATAAKALRKSHQSTAYHVKVLRDRCEMLEVTGRRQVGSTTEVFYRLKSRKEIASFDVSDLPAGVGAALQMALVSFFLESVSDFLRLVRGGRAPICPPAPGFSTRKGGALRARPSVRPNGGSTRSNAKAGDDLRATTWRRRCTRYPGSPCFRPLRRAEGERPVGDRQFTAAETQQILARVSEMVARSAPGALVAETGLDPFVLDHLAESLARVAFLPNVQDAGQQQEAVLALLQHGVVLGHVLEEVGRGARLP